MDLNQIKENWEKTGLLEPYQGDEALSLATCLESQRKMNETLDDIEFKRVSLPLVRRIYSESKAVERNHFINYFENTVYHNNYIFKNKFPKIDGSLEEQTEATAALASKMAKEIDVLFADQRNSKISFNGFDIMEDNSIVMYFN